MNKNNAFTSPSFGFLTIITIFPIFILCYFYFYTTLNAWFWTEDFPFYERYLGHIYFETLFHPELNAGRFLSRNVYWYLTGQFFGKNSEYYYAFNFFIISSTSYLIYKIFSNRNGAYFGLVSAIFYFCSTAVVYSYLWISNSQHLLPHFFVSLFIFYYIEQVDFANGKLKISSLFILITVFTFGLSSNLFGGLILCLPVWYMVVNSKIRKDILHWLLLVLCLILFLTFSIKLGDATNNSPYERSFSLETIRLNLNYYFNNDLLSIFWLISTLSGTLIFWRSNRYFEAWLFLASLIFYLPFAFLKHQRYLNYGTLTYLFFFLAYWEICFWVANKKARQLIPFMGAIVSLLILWFSMPQIRTFTENPRSSDLRKQVQQLKAFNNSEGRTIINYCFRPAIPVDKDVMPLEWYASFYGKAYSLYVDPNKHYSLSRESQACDITFIFEGPNLVRDSN